MLVLLDDIRLDDIRLEVAEIYSDLEVAEISSDLNSIKHEIRTIY